MREIRNTFEIADFENKLRMMGFDVNSQGNLAMVDLPPGSRNPSLPPKPPTAVATPSSSAGRKPSAAAASSVSSTPVSLGPGGGGYSLYSLIKKQSQSTSQRPAMSSAAKQSITSPAKSATFGSQPVSVLKKPSNVTAGSAVEKLSADSTKTGGSGRNAAVSFASVDSVEKAAAVDMPDSVCPQRFVL